jgi:hypothetical protein
MLKTRILFSFVFLIVVALFVFKIKGNKNQNELVTNQENKENYFEYFKNDFLSMWRENDKKISQVLQKERENKIPLENKIIKKFSTENKVSEVLAIKTYYPLNEENEKWLKEIKPGLIVLEASDETKLINFEKNEWQKNILVGLDLSKIERKYDFAENLNFLKKFDFVILPQISYFMTKDNYKEKVKILEKIIFSLQENKIFVFLGSYPLGLDQKNTKKIDWDIYKTLVAQIPFLGLAISNVEIDNEFCLFSGACVGDELIANRLKTTEDLFTIWNKEKLNIDVCWQILKNSDMIYLKFNLESENDFENLKKLKSDMELDYYKNDGVKTVVINSLKNLIKFKLDWGFQYD